jgi:hypothetical protein
LGLPALLIDRIDPRQEALHRRKQLILQPGDLLLPIGVYRSSRAIGSRTEARQLVRDKNSRRQMAPRRDAAIALSPCPRRSMKGAGVAATIGNR